MKRTRYTKFNGDLSSSFGLEDLMQALSDFLLDSGFQDPMSRFQSLDGEQTMENLREAIRQALDSGELFDEEAQEKYEALDEDQVEELIDQIIQKMQEQNFINAEQPARRPGREGDGETDARFEVTDKGMDFLGYKALRELLGPLGKSSSAATTPATRPPASRPTAPPSRTSSATPSTSTSPPPSQRLRPRRLQTSHQHGPAPSTSSTPTSTSSRPTTRAPAPPSSCSTARTP